MSFDARNQPVIVAIAGPNGAGKSTFFESQLASAGLRFINADLLALELNIDAYEAAKVAENLRQQMVLRRESFVFETVLSDPHGEKVQFLRSAAVSGYTVRFYFIGLDSASRSDRRVAGRVLQGGHDVPTDKLVARYPRTLANLARALQALPSVLVYDNSESARPYRFVAEYRDGTQIRLADDCPSWFKGVLDAQKRSGSAT